jgi:hypothetical protein
MHMVVMLKMMMLVMFQVTKVDERLAEAEGDLKQASTLSLSISLYLSLCVCVCVCVCVTHTYTHIHTTVA